MNDVERLEALNIDYAQRVAARAALDRLLNRSMERLSAALIDGTRREATEAAIALGARAYHIVIEIDRLARGEARDE